MNNLDWQWLKSQCMEWIKSPANDVKATEDVNKLKDEAVKRGFTREQVSKAIHKCRKIIDEESNIQQHAPAIPKSESKTEPATPTAQKADATTGAREGLQARAKGSPPPVSGLNPSGGKQRQSKISILDMLDKKQSI
jgi:hypothetical protein